MVVCAYLPCIAGGSLVQQPKIVGQDTKTIPQTYVLRAIYYLLDGKDNDSALASVPASKTE